MLQQAPPILYVASGVTGGEGMSEQRIEAEAPAPGVRPGYRYVVLAMLILAYTFNFLDRQILGILKEPIKNELHLSDTELGLMGGLAFAAL